MFEFKIGLVDEGELTFDKSFLHFIGKKQIHAKNYFKRKISI